MKNKNSMKKISFQDVIDFYFINADDEDDINKTSKSFYLSIMER